MTTHTGTATELGTLPIRKLLTQYSIPGIIAMTAASLYNMIDSIYIGQGVGAMAISGLALTFPFMNLAAAFGSLVGVGAATLISVRLGQKDYDTAQSILGNVVLLNVIIGLAFGFISLIFLDPILYFFGASDSTIGYARDFMRVILLGNVITHMYLGLNGVLRASGHPKQAMIATINTVVFNAILAPIFIYGFKWGIEGAALATVLSQAISLLRQIHILSNKNELIHLQRGIYRFNRSIVTNIIAIGMSPFLMNLAACFIVILINKGLKDYGGDYHIGAYGIVNRVGFFFVMIVMGLNQGMQPIAGYNYGAQKLDRVMRVLKLAILSAIVIWTIGWLISMFFPEYIARIFTNDKELIKLSVFAIRVDMLVTPVVGLQMVVTNFFQCIGKVKVSIFLSLSRQLLFLLPLLYTLPLFFGVNGVWYSLPISDFIAANVAFVMLLTYMRKFKKQLKLSENG